MAKRVRTTKILAEIYRSILRDKIRTKNQILIGPSKDIGLSFDSRGAGAYTTLIGKSMSKLLVVIGGNMISKVAKLPDEFTSRKTLETYFDDIVSAFYALDYHEMGHVLFTAMTDRTISEYPMPQYRGFLHSLFNIIEDPVVEINMANLFDTTPSLAYDINPQEFFDFLIERVFNPGDYKDDGTVNGFMNYLLLLLRCGKAAMKSSCAVFDKYSADLLPLIKDALYEPDAVERIHKVVTLGEWIIENIKEFDWELPEPEETHELPEPPGGPTIPGPRKSGVTPSDRSVDPSDEPGEEGKEPGEDGDEEGEPEKKDKKGEAPKPKESMDDASDEMDDIFNDIIHDGDDHEWVIAKDEYDVVRPEVVDKLDEQIDHFGDSVNDVTKFLKLFKGRIKPREQSGFTRGKLNVFRAMQDELRNGCDTKLFNQKINRGKDKDLAVSLLCDNSGSMSGLKSHLASEAAIALAQACDWADIPFECNCFTKTEDNSSGTCITITEKSFDDTFEAAKPYFAINDSSLIGSLKSHRYIPTFYGNSEEVNLFYIWKKFARVDHKTKLLFVMCDGATTGSKDELKKVVRQMEEEDGIIIIGIGICCHEVADIYPHHKLFSDAEELERGLAQYLVDTLSDYAI